jgi:hypothetical protein
MNFLSLDYKISENYFSRMDKENFENDLLGIKEEISFFGIKVDPEKYLVMDSFVIKQYEC